MTGCAVFRFDRAAARFALESVHPGETAASVRAATGFAFAAPEWPPETPAPGPDALALLRGSVREELAPIYPCVRRGIARVTAAPRRI